MRKTDQIPHHLYIFGSLFILANRVDTLMERALSKYGVSTKQWFLSICVASLFDKDPSLKDLAKVSGSSHQNIKQVALKLEQKDLMNLYKDPKDARVTRVRLSESSPAFWAQSDGDAQTFLSDLYRDIDEKDLKVVREVFEKLEQNLLSMEEK
jgi:DNA-binding MarR family transcriptional regulator